MTMNTNEPVLGFTFNIFDWYGPEFLIFYGISMILTAIWCSRRKGSEMKRFEVPGGKVLSDPYEIAFLSAGASRVAQVAVVRLLAAGKVEWVKKFSGPRLVAKGTPSTGGLKAEEAAILGAVLKRGERGLPAAEAGQQLGAVLPAIESRLAKLGLRPTAAERTSASFAISWPFLLIGLIGLIKLLVGINRDKPVAFLIVGLVLNGILLAYFANSGGYLTSAGKDLLERLRLQHGDRRRMQVSSPADDLTGVSLGLALFGASTLASVAGMEYLQKDLGRQMGQSGGDGGGGGCGTSGCGSSGCSSGCGGGGCGGCGGGGD